MTTKVIAAHTLLTTTLHGQGVLHGFSDGALAITDDCDNGYAQGLFHSEQERGQVGVARGQPALGQEDGAGETVTDDPQDFMAHVGLQAVEGHEDPALGRGDAVETIGILEGEAEQFIITLQEVGDCTLGHRDPVVDQGLMDLRDAAVLRIASSAHKGDDIEAELVLGQGQAAFGFRAIGFAKLRAVGVETAANRQCKT